MPLTDKGREILNQMERDHGSTVTVPVVAPVAEASDQAKLDDVMGMCQAYDQKDSARDLSRLKQLRDVANQMGKRARQGMGYSTTTAGFRLQGQAEKEAKKAKAAYQQARDEYARANNLSVDEVIALIKGSRNDEAESTQLDDVMATCDEYEKKDDVNKHHYEMLAQMQAKQTAYLKSGDKDKAEACRIGIQRLTNQMSKENRNQSRLDANSEALTEEAQAKNVTAWNFTREAEASSPSVYRKATGSQDIKKGTADNDNYWAGAWNDDANRMSNRAKGSATHQKASEAHQKCAQFCRNAAQGYAKEGLARVDRAWQRAATAHEDCARAHAQAARGK